MAESLLWSAGQLSAAVLNLSKERVNSFAESAYQGLAGEWPDMPWLGFFPDDTIGSADDLVSFRVYIRFYLTKCRESARGDGEALTLFTSKLNELERVLFRQEHPRRTKLPETKKGFMVSFGTANLGGGDLVCSLTDVGTFGDLMLLDFMLSLANKTSPKACSSCGTFFIPVRPVESYCPDCRAIGERQRLRALAAQSDPAIMAFRRTAGRIYTRKSRGKLPKEEAFEMLRQSEELRDQALEGSITTEELISRLEEITG